MADEQDRIARLRALEKEQAAKASAPVINPLDVRDPKTGLTPAQVAANKAVQEASKAAGAVGVTNVIIPGGPGQASSISTPPSSGLQAGYEWYFFNLPGGGGEWRQRPGRDLLIQAFGGNGGNDDDIGGGGKKVVSTYTDPNTGDTIAVYDDGTTAVLAKGTKQADAARAAAEKTAAEQAQRQSAFDLLLSQFTQYGLQALVEPLRALIKQGVPASEFTIRLRETDAYKKRFAANAQRINKGLRALSEAEYIKLEDDYQDVMRRYGLPTSYYERGELGRQQGFEKFIAGDVSAPELERRVQLAQERVMDADPMIGQTLREFYPTITNGEILAFALDPDRALPEINRKITAAEIGAAQYGAKLTASRIRAEELAAAGVTGKQYQQAAPTIADIATRGSTLAQFYEQAPFGQVEAEQETLGISGAAEARERRRRLTGLEQASFAGRSGPIGGALGRDRAGAI